MICHTKCGEWYNQLDTIVANAKIKLNIATLVCLCHILLGRIDWFVLTLDTTSCQFHQHFTSSFCADILATKKLQSQTATIEKLHTRKKLRVKC